MDDIETALTEYTAQPDRHVSIHPRAAAFESAHRTGDFGRLALDSMVDIEDDLDEVD